MIKKIIVIPLAVATVVIVAYLLFGIDRRMSAPAFRLPEINGGRIVSEKDFIGRLTLLNFWYPSCPGCAQEMPKLVALENAADKPPNFRIIAVSLNENSESEVKAYVRLHRLPFDVAYDRDGRVREAYEIQFAPSTFIIDETGKILRFYIGEPDWTEVKEIIDSARGDAA